jgi:heat shock protein HslJ
MRLWGVLGSVIVLALGCGAGGGAVGSSDSVAAPVAENGDAAPSADGSRPPTPIDLEGAWLLEDLGGRGVIDMVQTTIEFDGNGGVLGSGGCNRYTGSYTFEDGRLTFGPLAGTKKMCPGAVMDQEDRFHRALGAVERVALDGPFLLIFVEATEQPLRFTRMSGEVED